MRSSILLCVIVASIGVLAQDAQPTVDSNLAAAISAVQVQQFLSTTYGSLILDFQSAMGWMQVAHGWAEMTQRESTGRALEENQDLEESDDDDGTSFLQEEFTPYHQAPQSYDDLERSTEYQLLYVLKLMYVQAGNKLSAAQQSNYQTKIKLAMLQGVAGNNAVSSVLYMMYYLETLKVMSSSVTIQRQDAWNTWLLYEILETNEFENSRAAVPAKFNHVMAQSRLAAANLWQMETLLDLYILYLEYYLQMVVASMAPAPAPATTQAGPATPSSFLETEAEPNKPFIPLMATAAFMAPQYMGYYQIMLRFWGAVMHYQAAQGFVMSSQVDNPELASHVNEAKQYMSSALQQWAWIKVMTTTMDYYTLAMALRGGAAHNNAATSNLVQTEAEATPLRAN